MEVFHQIQGTLQDMQADTRAVSHDLKQLTARMTARMDHLDEGISKLMGTFASIEQMFLDHEKRIRALENRPPAA